MSNRSKWAASLAVDAIGRFCGSLFFAWSMMLLFGALSVSVSYFQALFVSVVTLGCTQVAAILAGMADKNGEGK
jgi:AraC-like DNA-binding protein